MAKTMMEVYEIEKIQSFRRLGVTVECITAYGKNFVPFLVKLSNKWSAHLQTVQISFH